jgi:hypothetical protein
MRKALEYQALPVFEPKRSNYPNRLNKKELAYQRQHGHRQRANCRMQINISVISTVGGN